MENIYPVKVNCSSCGSWRSGPVIKTPDYELHIDIQFEISRCRDCGFIYTSVRPDYDTLYSRFYPDEYICYGKKTNNFIADLIDRKRIEGQAIQRCGLLKKFLRDGGPAAILEIGCATGEFLKACKGRIDCEAEGVEPNGRLCDAVRKEGFNIIGSTFENAVLQDKKYDAICLFNVFEHLWDPIHALKKINRLLKPGGLLFVEIPNFGSLTRQLFGRYWFLYHLPRHLSFFDRRKLEEEMTKSGFERVVVTKQFRPTVDVLSFQYFIYDKVRSEFIRHFCSAENPLMIFAGIFAEAAHNIVGDSNIISAIYRKRSAIQPMPSLLQQKKYENT